MFDTIDSAGLEHSFSEYRSNGSEESLRLVVRMTAPWLYNIVYQLVADETEADEILKRVYDELTRQPERFPVEAQALLYSMFLIAKKLVLRG